MFKKIIFYCKNNFLLLGVIILCNCSGVNPGAWKFPYMMNVQQGVYITNQQFAKIKIGMTKDQVIFIIGSPLSQFLFNQNRWDYQYQSNINNKTQKNYLVTIYFDKNGNVIKTEKKGVLFDEK